MLKELVETMAKALVDYPDKVSVSELETGYTLVLELEVASGDMGKVIGKKGQNANAMREILAVASRIISYRSNIHFKLY